MQNDSQGSGDVRAVVTDVQRFSVHDGPGIRTLVFFKGCPLRCRWCHNPETQRAAPEIRFQPARCIGCGACTRSCAQEAHAFVSHAESAENTEVQSHAESAENAEVQSHAEGAENAEVQSHAEGAENAEVQSHEEGAENAEVQSHAESAENAEVQSRAESAENAEVQSHAEGAGNAEVQSHAEGAENAERARHLFDRARCVACGACAAACPAGALERVGEERRVADLVAVALRDAPFYGRDGGLTVSGGEPLAQPDALFALLAAAREAGLTTCVETCGAFDSALAPRLAALADTILFDLKDTDAARLRENTGADLDAILRTLRALDAAGANLALRCVLVPGVNLCESHTRGVADVFRSLVHARSVELLPYHAFGAGKAESLGRSQRLFETPDPAAVDAFARVLRDAGVPVKAPAT